MLGLFPVQGNFLLICLRWKSSTQAESTELSCWMGSCYFDILQPGTVLCNPNVLSSPHHICKDNGKLHFQRAKDAGCSPASFSWIDFPITLLTNKQHFCDSWVHWSLLSLISVQLGCDKAPWAIPAAPLHWVALEQPLLRDGAPHTWRNSVFCEHLRC